MNNMNEGLLYAGMGILVVFSVLVVLMLVIMLMQVFAKNNTEQEKPAASAPAPTVSAPSVTPAIDTDETIAVIAAAVAAMSGDDPNKRLRVKSIVDQAGTVLWRASK